MKHEITSNDIMAAIKSGAQAIGDHHDQPDDDWAPTLFASVQGELAVLELVGLPSDAEERADMIGQALSDLKAKPQVIGCVLSAWTYALEKPEDQRETLIVQAMDTHQHLVEMAQINRWDGRPPTLGTWERWDSKLMIGPLVDVFHAAIGPH